MYHEPSERKASESRKDYVASSLLISLTLIIVVLFEVFDPKMGSLTMFSLERRDPLPFIALMAGWPPGIGRPPKEVRQARARAAILLVAGAILMIIGLLLLPLRFPLIRMNNTSLQIALALILIIASILVMLLGAYYGRIEARWHKGAQPRYETLLVYGAILLFTGLVLLLLIRTNSILPQTMEEQTPLVALSLILIIAGIFAMALGAYIHRAELKRGPYISPESPRKK
jgi:magnesium-transporting ATPase (P-type)